MEQYTNKDQTSDKTFNASTITKYFKNQTLPEDMTKPFIDDFFPPNEDSLLGLKNLESIDPEAYAENINDIDVENIFWKRASEIFPEFLLFEGKIEFNDIKQGNLGNCYFLSALASLTEFPNLIFKIFKTKEVSQTGLYEISLFIDGEWQIVIVDDFIPMSKQTEECAFAQPNINEIWVIILEKAWAKVNGGYLNTIGGYASEPLSVLTGFSKRCVKTDELELDALWQIIKEEDLNDNIMCCATRNNEDCAQRNLVALHAYTLISAKGINLDGKEIRLCKIRNPHGSKEWNGDWSDTSPLWNDKLDILFDHKVKDQQEFNDGLFFICIEDFVKYFKIIYICNTMYNSQIKKYLVTETEIEKPQVFSLYLPFDSDVSITANAPFWRFNRNLKNKNHPITLLLARVNIASRTIGSVNFIDGDFCADDDPSLKKKLLKGYYLIWVYSGLDENKQRNIDKYFLRICANTRFLSNKEKTDSEFKLMREIILTGLREQFKSEIAKDNKLGKLENSFLQTGIAYYVKFNNTTSSHFKFEVDALQKLGFNLLPPFDNTDSFELYANPGSELTIFGMKNIQYGRYCFSLDMTVSSCNQKFEEDPTGDKLINSPFQNKLLWELNQFLKNFFDFSFYNHNKNPSDDFYDYISPSCEEAKFILEFQSLDVNEISKEQLIKEFPDHMQKLLKYPSVDKNKNLTWKKVQFKNGTYLGQINKESERHGRGVYIFIDRSFMLGYFENSERSGAFEEYGSDKKLVFKGNYLNGKKNGQGIYYYSNGSYYDGEFQNDVRHGTGTFAFSSDEKYVGSWVDNKKEGKGTYFYSQSEFWDGTFLNNQFHGTGRYRVECGDYKTVTYDNGKRV